MFRECWQSPLRHPRCRAICCYLVDAGGWVLVAYLALTVLYSFYFKRLAIIDVLTIAIGFVLRVYAGAIAGVQPTVWILFVQVCWPCSSLYQTPR